jgi:ACR3 family arsenite efflux pump ArsB
MGFDLGALGVAIVSVLGVGLLLGAGIPLIYGLAIRSLESRRPGSTAVAVALLSLCALLALAGIVVIVFGKQLFGF